MRKVLNGTQTRYGWASVPNVVLGNTVNFGRGNLLNLGLPLFKANTPPKSKNIRGDVVRIVDGSIALGNKFGEKVIFSLTNLVIGDFHTESLPLILQLPQKFFQLHSFTDKVRSPESGVFVSEVKRLEGLCQMLSRGNHAHITGNVDTTAMGKIPIAQQL